MSLTIDQIERRPSFGDRIRFIKEELPKIAQFRVYEAGADSTADNLAKTLQAIVDLTGSPEAAAQTLLDLTADIEEQPSNDHFHRALYEMGPKRKGALVAVSHIKPHSNESPDLHDHPMDCLEFVVPLTEGMFSITEEDGKIVRTPIPALKAFCVERGVLHSDYNAGGQELVYVIYRAKTFEFWAQSQ